MKTKIIASILLSLTLATLSFELIAAVLIKGGASCGKWIKDRKENSFPSTGNKYWLLGYLSGLAAKSDINILDGIDNKSIFLWTDNYCNTHPLKYLDDTGLSLFYELKKGKNL